MSAKQNKSSLSNKMSTVAPTLFSPKIRPFQLSRRVWRLSPSSYSTPLPPPSLSTAVFVVHRSITHAIASNSRTCFSYRLDTPYPTELPRRIAEWRFGWCLLFYTRTHRSLIGWQLARSLSTGRIWRLKSAVRSDDWCVGARLSGPS